MYKKYRKVKSNEKSKKKIQLKQSKKNQKLKNLQTHMQRTEHVPNTESECCTDYFNPNLCITELIINSALSIININISKQFQRYAETVLVVTLVTHILFIYLPVSGHISSSYSFCHPDVTAAHGKKAQQ